MYRPSVAVSSPIRTLANVDLPQPDSPTMASVSTLACFETESFVGFDTRFSPPPKTRVCRDLVVFFEVVDPSEQPRPTHLWTCASPAASVGIPIDFFELSAPAVMPVVIFDMRDILNIAASQRPCFKVITTRAEITAIGAFVW